jgi:homoserine O-acetyltransferase
MFDVRLPDLPLERGGVVRFHHARGWWWGPETDLPALSEKTHLLPKTSLTSPLGVYRRDQNVPAASPSGHLDPSVPTVLVVHALTGDSRAGGDLGWWSPLVGVGRPLDPTRFRLICFNNLGSNYGSTGPLDEGWPEQASLTTVDQARALWSALDALGLKRLHLAAGGSLGGMIVLAMAALRPNDIERLMPIAASVSATAWLIGFNHVQRQVIRLHPNRGLEVARQLAMLTYRAEPGLEAKQSRTQPLTPGAQGRYRIEGYLEHQGVQLQARFAAPPYLAQLDAMDSHDLIQGDVVMSTVGGASLVVDIDTDVLYTPQQVALVASSLQRAGSVVERATIRSPHGHDAFLIEWEQLSALVRRAVVM